MADFTFGPVGAIHRPAIRRAAARFGVTLSEIKDWGQSQFTVTGSTPMVRAFHEFVAGYAARNDAIDAEEDAREAGRQARHRWWNPVSWAGPVSGVVKYLGLYLGLVLGIPLVLVGLLMLCGVKG